MRDVMIKVEKISKEYQLGTIGGTTLKAEIQRKMAKIRGKEDPNLKIGERAHSKNERFMALKDVSFEVKRGEAVGIIGYNGAGKSTLLKLMARVTAPTAGTIILHGQVASMLEVGTGFHPELTGRENIYMNGAILGMTKKEIDAKIEDIIDFSEIRQFIDTPVKRYSSGMYVKLAFAVAAHMDAEILIMDEVLAVGDMKFQKKCLGKMGEVSSEDGKTILYVSHNMSTIRQLCTRCIVLDHGRILFDGDVESAIAIYLERDNNNFPCYYDLRTIKRPSSFHGALFFVDEFEFVGKDKARFFSDERIKYRIKWHAMEKVEDLRISFTIQDTDRGEVVGLSQSDSFGDVKSGERGESVFELDVSNLVEGHYAFELDIYNQNEFGTFCSYDHPRQNFYFEILQREDYEGMTWQKKYWGNVMLNTMHVLAKR